MKDFPYMRAAPALTASEQEEKFIAMHIREIVDLATLMRNLDYDKASAKKRIRDNIMWSFEGLATPSFYKQVDQIVEDVFSVSR